MNRRHAVVAVVAFCVCSPALGVEKGKAKYMGGTLSGIPEKTDGAIDVRDNEKLRWIGDKGKGRFEIPWASVTDLEYGQKASRRWRTAILISPIALFAKARKHYVTFSYKDGDGADQGAVFEFDKDDIRQVLVVIKARTGKEITYQDEEAKKQMGGGAAEKP